MTAHYADDVDRDRLAAVCRRYGVATLAVIAGVAFHAVLGRAGAVDVAGRQGIAGVVRVGPAAVGRVAAVPAALQLVTAVGGVDLEAVLAAVEGRLPAERASRSASRVSSTFLRHQRGH